jgi:hypothetical protein
MIGGNAESALAIAVHASNRTVPFARRDLSPV